MESETPGMGYSKFINFGERENTSDSEGYPKFGNFGQRSKRACATPISQHSKYFLILGLITGYL
jgi:hypothetical protein